MPTIQKTLRILEFIKAYLLSNGKAPTLREIAVQFDLGIPATHQHLKKMEVRGWIRRTRRWRGIEIVNA